MKVKRLTKKQEGKRNVTRQRDLSRTNPPSGVGGRSWHGSWEKWASIVTLSVMLWIMVWSVAQAEWITPQPSLVLVLFLALATGLALSKSRLPGIAAHALALVLGVGVILWQGTSLQPEPGIAEKFGHLVSELQLWWAATSAGMPNPGTVQVALMLSFLVWLLGYVSIWFVLRRRNPWVAVFLGATGLLINQTNLAEIDYVLFFLYLLAALFLVAQTTSVKHFLWFGKRPVYYREWGMKYFLVSVLCLSVLTLSLVSLTPQPRVPPLETLVKTKIPWGETINSYWRDFFAAVPAQKPVHDRDGKGTLPFTVPPDSSDEVLFVIKAERPSYWWTQRYDIYTPDGWLTSPRHNEVLRPGAIRIQGGAIPPHIELTYTVIPQTYTNVLLGAGEPISSNIPMAMKTLEPLVFDIDLTHPSEDGSLPPDIDSVANALRADLTRNSRSESELEQRLLGDLELVDTQRNDVGQITSISVARPRLRNQDVVTILSPGPLMPKQGYTITARIASPNAIQLLQAGDDYPKWITDRYLQLPPDFPEAIRQLAEDLTDDLPYTPCDKAMLIRQFLSQIPYSEDFEAPPSGVDGVEHFLFTQKSGNCVYFASAMAVMLRSIGVPSRVSIGYLPGQRDAEHGGYIVREADYHAWPEVYFPNYGWIQFEVTPGRSLGEADEYLWLLAGEPPEEDPQVLEEEPLDEDPQVLEEEPWTFAEGYLTEEEFELFAEEYLGEDPQVLEEEPLGEDPQEPEEEPLGEGFGFIEGDYPDGDMNADASGSIAASETSAVNLPWLALGITVVLLMLGLASYRSLSRFIGLSPASAVYARMCLLASLVKLGPQPQQTALEYSTKLSAAFPHQAKAIGNIAQIYVATQYSHTKALELPQKQRLQEFWRQVRRALLLRLFRMK
jgi:hypothetical protein